MVKVRVIPCLDVKDGRVVKGVQFVSLRDAGDPVEAEENQKRLLASVPMGRLCRPEEAAYAALWLASDEASFVTGVALPIDGGFTAR